MGKRILIVEDEAIVRLHLQRVLERAGYEVVGTAASAADAVARADECAPDLVLMDIQLSGDGDGVSAAGVIRERHDAALVFLTAFADEATLLRTEAVGAQGYVVKPFHETELRATISTALASRERERNRRLVGDPESVEVPRRPKDDGPRLVIYSHDTFGLGHLRRSLNIARGMVSRFRDLSVLVVTGSPVAHRFELPERVDYVKLPAVRKVAPEKYAPRMLEVPDDSITALRANLLLRTVRDFEPDVLLVDHSPVGMLGELRPSLRWLDAHAPGCAKILGLRDILDGPDAVVEHWTRTGIYDALRNSYDVLAIYGMPEVFDPVSAYQLPPDVGEKATFVNYVVEADDVGGPPAGNGNAGRHLCVTIGGGDGGAELVIGGVLGMMEAGGADAGLSATILPGPFAPADLIEAYRERANHLAVEITAFTGSSTPHMKSADLVVCTGGYNTMLQAARYARRTLVIPRTLHRAEQRLRAERFAALGISDYMEPDQLNASTLLARVMGLLSTAPTAPTTEIQYDGAARLAELIHERGYFQREHQEATND